MLKFNKVRKYFNGRMILDILSLELDSNLYWVQGENGSGKSTFLRMVAGLIPFEGQILLRISTHIFIQSIIDKIYRGLMQSPYIQHS
jgi:ABC-2 type transport system ATP-binding protein